MKPILASLPLFLAESSYQGVRSSALGEWLVQAAALAVIALVVWQLVDRVRGGAPQKREVSFSREYVARPEYDRDRKELDEELGRMARNRKEHYKEVELQGRQIVELKTRVDAHDRAIAVIDQKLDALPDRIARMLKS